MHKIYGLYDPRIIASSPIVRYVGYTGKGLAERVQEHLADARRAKFKNYRMHWIRRLVRAGVVPGVIVLEECYEHNWQERERFWIEKLQGNRLVNSTAGGEGLVNPSAEVRARIGLKVSAGLIGNSRRKGIPHDEETRLKISIALRNSDAVRLFHAGRKGIPRPPVSEETRAKISAIHTGMKRPPFTAEHIEKIRLSNLGRKHSEETKEKMRQKLFGNQRGKGSKRTPEHIEAIRKFASGTKWINNGIHCKKIPLTDAIPEGYRLGMKLTTQ